jgi:hypothetical protein
MDVIPLSSEKECIKTYFYSLEKMLKESKTSLHPITDEMEHDIEKHQGKNLVSKNIKK